MDHREVIAIYDRLIAQHDEVERKGKANAYTAINGNMFSFVGPDAEMCLRLSKENVALFGAEHDASPVIRHNAVMRGYVAVSKGLLRDEEELSLWFSRAVSDARALPAKPTKKKS